MFWLWLGFGLVVIILLALDLGVFHRNPHEIGVKEAVGWTVLWISVGLAFSIPVYFIYENHWFGIALQGDGGDDIVSGGGKAVGLYLTGYFLEKSLSVDNIFVMAIVFAQFKVIQRHQHRVLYWGILGAIVMRAAMIFGGVWLFTRFTWLFYVFGAYLMFIGVKMLVEKEKDEDVEKKWYIRGLKKILPITSDFDGAHFTVKRDGKRLFTTLFLALVVIELTDVVFAVDSVPAVLSLTTDPFLVLTSNVFAILGLRSLYFVLSAMMERFTYLKHSLSFILFFIGAKMAAHEFIHIPILVSLGVILLFFTGGVVISLVKTRNAVE